MWKSHQTLALTWRYGEGAKRSDLNGMSGRFSGFRLSLAGFRWQMCRCQRLLSAFETAFGPLGPEDLSWQKIRLSADSAPACTAETAQLLLAEFRFSVDWPPFSPDLNLLDFSLPRFLQAKVQFMPHSNLAAQHPSIAQNGTGWQRFISAKTSAHSAAGKRPLLRKIMFERNRWLANSPTHINQPFSGLKKVK
jgi:hypothetical protein